MKRVSMKDVANMAGVSRPTVSRALRGNTEISAATTERIRRLAVEMGYQRDPAFDVLARERWGEAAGGFRQSLGFLVHPDLNRDAYLRGARGTAERLGYAVDALEMEMYSSTRALSRVLEARGIRGLILPTFTDRYPAPGLNWSRYAVVACSVDLYHPPFHVVRSNVVRKVEMAWEHARACGYRRIAIVLPHTGPHELDLRRKGAALQCLSTLPKKQQVPLWCESIHRLRELPGWLRRQRPDAVIAGIPAVVHILNALPEAERIPHCCLLPEPGCAHISSRPERIGSVAMSILHQQVVENQLGPPEDPFTVVIEPAWINGPGW